MTRLSVDQLLDIAARYYPDIGDTNHLSGPEADRLYFAAPETQALQAVQEAATPRMPEWHELLAALRSQLPGCTVGNETQLRYDACFGAVIQVTEPGLFKVGKLVMVYSSLLVPYYLIYELQRRKRAGGHKVVARRDTPTSATAPAFPIMEREMAERFGQQRFPPELAGVVVPTVCMHNFGPGEVTLADALFTEHRW